MSAADDYLSLMGPASLPDTVHFPYDGQTYSIPLEGYGSEEEAIDAFLSQQNAPVNIEPTEEVITDVQAQPTASELANQAFDFSQPVGGNAVSSALVEEEAPEEDLPFSLDNARRSFSGSVFNTVGEGLQGVAISDISRRRRDAGNINKVVGSGGFSDPKDQAVDFLGYMMSGGKVDKETTDALLEESIRTAPGIDELLDGGLYKAGEGIKNWAEEMFPTDEAYQDAYQTHLAAGGGSLVAFAISALGTPVLTAGFGASVNASTQFQDAIASGADFDTALNAADIGSVVGLTEALPISNVVRRIDQGTGGLFSKTITKQLRKKLGNKGKIAGNALGGAVEEALQEAFVDVANDYSAKDIIGYDEDREIGGTAAQSAEIGGTLGFMLSAVASGLGIGKRNLQAGAKRRLRSDLSALRAEERALQEESDRIPKQEITDTLPDPVSITPQEAANDTRVDDAFQKALADIQTELGETGSVLTPREMERLANLRADTRTDAVGGQLELFDPQRPPEQQRLDLQRDFQAPNQFPDSGTQQELPLSGGVNPQSGPSAEVVPINPPTQPTSRPYQETTGTRNQQRLARGESIPLHRGLKEDGKPRGYPGEFFTEDETLAKDYASTSQAEGEVVTRDFSPEKAFDVDSISKQDNEQMKLQVEQFAAENNIPLEDMYLYDVLWKGETDFAYPVQADVDFLKSQGYDSVRFENEGGQRVASWFVFDSQTEAAPLQPTSLADKLKKGMTVFRGAFNSSGDTIVKGDIGSHFDPDSALAGKMVGETGEVGEFKVKSKKPLVVDREPTNGTWHNPMEVIQILRDSGMRVPIDLAKQAQSAVNKALAPGGGGIVADAAKGSPLRKSLDALGEFLKSHGYDTIVYPNQFEADGAPSVIVLDPKIAKHVKSSKPAVDAQPSAEILDFSQAQNNQQPPAPPQADQLNEADQIRLESERLEAEKRSDIDAIERAGYDTGLLQEQNEAENAIFDERPATEPLVKTGTVIEGGQQRRLPLREVSSEPVTPFTEQELPLTGGGAGGGGPVDTGGGRPPRLPPREPPSNVPPAVAKTGTSLQQVAESRPTVGEPTAVYVNEDGSAASVDGRTPINQGRDNNSDLKYVPNKLRLWVDIALTTGLRKHARSDAKIMKEILRAHGKAGRAHAKHVENSIAKIENTYKMVSGKRLEKAPQEHLSLFTEFMNGRVSREELTSATKVDEAFMDALDVARISIREMSDYMLQQDMIPSELRLTFENNAGSYLSVSYAANVLNQNETATDLLNKIPEAVRNQWVNTFQRAYVDPVNNLDLVDKSMGELRRLVKMLGLVERRRVPDPEGEEGATKDIIVLQGDSEYTPYTSANRLALMEVLSEFGGLSKDEITNIMLKSLASTSGGVTGGRGKDHSIERRLTLAKPAEQLVEEGFNAAEIAHNQATRDLLLETVNPATNIGVTMNKMMSTIQAHRMINDIASLSRMGSEGGNRMVSIGNPDAEAGLTELLVPRGSSMADIRIPDPNNLGEYVYAAPQQDVAGKQDGIYVSPRMARMFQHMTAPGKSSPASLNLIRSLAGLTKVNLTALSPRSHPRNIGTAAALLALRGHAMTNPKQLMDSFSTVMGVAARDLGNQTLSKNEQRALTQNGMDVILEYFTSLGLFNDSVRTGPVRELLTKVLESRDAELLGQNTYVDEQYQSIEGVLEGLSKRGKTKVGRIASGLMEKPMAMFRLEDEAVKAIAFMIERRRYAKITGRQDIVDMIDGKVEMTTEQLAEMRQFDSGIANYITDLYPTYSRVPVGVRALSRNFVATPFPSFTAEMWRNGLNDYKDLGDLASGRGRYDGVSEADRMSLLGMRVMVKGAYHSGVSGMVSSATMLGLSSTAIGTDPTDDEFDEAFKESMRILNKTGTPINAKDLDLMTRQIAPMYMADSLFDIIDIIPGETITLRNLTFTLPNSQQLEAAFGLANTLELMLSDGDMERAGKRLVSTTIKLASDYAKADVLAATVAEAVEGRTATGMPIWDQTDDTWEKSYKQAKYISSVLMPTSRVVREGEKFLEATKEGRLLDEAREFITGTNDTVFRIDTLWSSKMRVLQDDASSISNTTTEINRLLRSNDEMSDDKFIKKYLALEEQRYEAFQETRKVVRAGESLGMTKRQMQEVIDSSLGLNNPGGMTVGDILREKYTPYEPDFDQVLKGYHAPRSGRLSPDEKRDGLREHKPIMKDRLRLMRSYRRQLRYGDFTL